MVKHLSEHHKLLFIPCEMGMLNEVRDFITAELKNCGEEVPAKYIVASNEIINFEFQLGATSYDDTYYIGIIADNLKAETIKVLNTNLCAIFLEEIIKKLKEK